MAGRAVSGDSRDLSSARSVDAPMPTTDCTLNRTYKPECRRLPFNDLRRVWAATRTERSNAAKGLTMGQVDPAACFGRGDTALSCCFQNCSFRGRCVRGVCACDTPWSGYDCKDDDRSRRQHSTASDEDGQGFVYVHSPPSHLGLKYLRRFQSHGGYSTDYFFLRRMLGDKRIRTLRPERALLFWVPTFATERLGNQAFQQNALLLESLIQWLTSAGFGEHFAANRSRYVFSFTGDKGACFLPPGPIRWVHWGLRTPWEFMNRTHEFSLAASDAAPAEARLWPCSSALDVVVPPYMAAWVDYAPSTPHPAPWECELFFAGSTTHENAIYYSQGIRQLVIDHHAHRPNFCLTSHAHLPPDEYLRRFRNARFCLAPSGEGWGDRLHRAMRAGCVPLIMQPNVSMPFEDVLPYARFSLRLGRADVPTLHRKLAAISPTTHEELRRNVHKYAPAFNWHESRGRAYEYARFSLCRRAYPRDSAAKKEACASLRPRVASHVASIGAG